MVQSPKSKVIFMGLGVVHQQNVIHPGGINVLALEHQTEKPTKVFRLHAT